MVVVAASLVHHHVCDKSRMKRCMCGMVGGILKEVGAYGVMV